MTPGELRSAKAAAKKEIVILKTQAKGIGKAVKAAEAEYKAARRKADAALAEAQKTHKAAIALADKALAAVKKSQGKALDTTGRTLAVAETKLRALDAVTSTLDPTPSKKEKAPTQSAQPEPALA